MDDVRWLGFDWDDRAVLRLRLFRAALRVGRAADQEGQGLRLRSDGRPGARAPRRRSPQPGKHSPYRDRSVDENLDLFRRMRAGEFPDGARTLRAKIDMASPNFNLRDPVMYRILHATHHRTGDKWCIYPMYDCAHGQSRFDREDHALDLHAGIREPSAALRLVHREAGHLPPAADRVRPPEPHLHGDEQAEAAAARARKARQRLGRSAHADDLRLPPPRLHAGGDPRSSASGSAWRSSTASIDIGLARERSARRSEQAGAARAWPCCGRSRSSSTNYPEGQIEELDAVNNPEDPSAGTRKVPFSRVLYIEQDDFREDPPKEFFPPRARQRSAAALRLFHQVHRASSRIRRRATSPNCTAPTIPQPAAATRPTAARSRGRSTGSRPSTPSTRRCGCTIICSPRPDPDDVPEGQDYKVNLNPELAGGAARLLSSSRAWRRRRRASRFQFERLGYFCVDPDSTPAKLVFNRTVSLRTRGRRSRRRGNEGSCIFGNICRIMVIAAGRRARRKCRGK